MKFFKLDLLTLLISLFILNSCKNQDTIGLGVTTSNQLNGSLIDTSTIVINTVPEDSVVTDALPQTPMGFFNDPIFGTTESNIAFDLNLPSAYVAPTGTLTIDSAILVLRYSSGFYGDSLASRYKANVYQLNERLFSNSTYYNTKQWNYNSGVLLGTKSFFARTHDSIGVKVIVAGGIDTIQKVPAQLRIPIDKNFINTVLFNASATQTSSNLVFKNNVHGLYVTMDKTGTTGAGGTFMMALDSNTRIDVYYKSAQGTTVDTTLISMPSTLHAAQIKHTYSAAIQTELSHTTTGSRNTFYLQGNAGLRAKISFPYLKNVIKTIGTDIVVNRAELIITPTPGSFIPFTPLPRISLYRTDLAGQRTPLEDAAGDVRSAGTNVFGGYYSYTNQNYHFLVTAYVSDLIKGALDYGTFIGTADLTTDVSAATYMAPNAQVSARTFAVGSDKTSPYRIKLNIIYTKIAK